MSFKNWRQPEAVAQQLELNHYLGMTMRGMAWEDEFGVIVFAPPTSRHFPNTWLEVTRWCILSKEKNAGSRQWKRAINSLRELSPSITTIVSYSDPSVGHTGALYKACNWLWAPTWHRLRPPPTGNGKWTQNKENESVKDRWIFPVRPDPERVRLLQIDDTAVLAKFPWALYQEPSGVPWKRHD